MSREKLTVKLNLETLDSRILPSATPWAWQRSLLGAYTSPSQTYRSTYVDSARLSFPSTTAYNSAWTSAFLTSNFVRFPANSPLSPDFFKKIRLGTTNYLNPSLRYPGIPHSTIHGKTSNYLSQSLRYPGIPHATMHGNSSFGTTKNIYQTGYSSNSSLTATPINLTNASLSTILDRMEQIRQHEQLAKQSKQANAARQQYKGGNGPFHYEKNYFGQPMRVEDRGFYSYYRW